jgi:hypothetical protein
MPPDAIAAIVGFLSFLHVLPNPARAVEGWLDLFRRRPVTGGDVFDLQLAATMLANGVQVAEKVCQNAGWQAKAPAPPRRISSLCASVGQASACQSLFQQPPSLGPRMPCGIWFIRIEAPPADLPELPAAPENRLPGLQWQTFQRSRRE